MVIFTLQKIKFFIKDIFSKCDQINPRETAGLVTFTEEIFNGKCHFFGPCLLYRYDIITIEKGNVPLLSYVYHFHHTFIILLHLGEK